LQSQPERKRKKTRPPEGSRANSIYPREFAASAAGAVRGQKYAKVRTGRQRMTLGRPRSGRYLETPIERIFRKVIRRRMTKAERRDFHIKIEPRILIK
jgi:hypothetical protein